MVKIPSTSRRKEKVFRAEECCEIAVDAVARHITIPINGSLKPRTIIQSLVGMSTNNLSIHSITQIVERIPCETSVRYHLSKLDLVGYVLQGVGLDKPEDPRIQHHRVRRRGVPFGRRAEARVEVGLAFGQQAEFERAAHADQLVIAKGFEVARQRRVGVGAAAHDPRGARAGDAHPDRLGRLTGPVPGCCASIPAAAGAPADQNREARPAVAERLFALRQLAKRST